MKGLKFEVWAVYGIYANKSQASELASIIASHCWVF